MRGFALGLLMGLSSCATTARLEDVPLFARSEAASDFDTYSVRRVGLVPFRGAQMGTVLGGALTDSFLSEVTRSTPYEIVRLDPDALREVARSDAYLRGHYEPETIIEVARRYRLDAVLFGTVVQHRFYPPQQLGLQVDLVAAETGLAIWSGTCHLDATDRRVRDGLRTFFERGEEAGANADNWEIALLSPAHIARFAAYQIARVM